MIAAFGAGRRTLGVLLCAFLLAPSGVTADSQREPQSESQSESERVEAKVEESLRTGLMEKGAGEYFVYLRVQPDLSVAQSVSDWTERGRTLYDHLVETARAEQARLIELLLAEQATGEVDAFRAFFIVNAIHVNSTLEVLDQLAAHPDVSHIEAAGSFAIPEPIPGELEALEWGVERIGAPAIWAQGVTGDGIVVANIDTGVDYDHPALIERYRGYLNPGFDHDFNWYDPSNVCGGTSPCDNVDHGTHTMGTMIGDDGGDNQIGVAPGAKWIAAKGCEHTTCSDVALLASAEWILAPCPSGIDPGDPRCDPAKRPHVVNNSWGGLGGDTWYLASVNAWRAMGIFPAFSAGNNGPSPVSLSSPGDYEESFAAGATKLDDTIAGFSSRGPSALTSEIKPDLSAPGSDVRSSIDGGGYASFSGTSMASPHVAGCVALLLSAAIGELEIELIEDLLRDTAVDLGDPGADDSYGHGRLDCQAAFAALEPSFTLEPTPDSRSVCAPSVAIYRLDVGSVQAFDDPVALTAAGPTGALLVVEVFPALVTPPDAAYVIAYSSVAGEYEIVFRGESGDIAKSTSVMLRTSEGVPAASALVGPGNGATDQPLNPLFEWKAAPGATEYWVLVVGSSGGPRYAITNETQHTFADPLDADLLHVWSVVPINACGYGPQAAPSFFSTGKVICSSPQLPILDNTIVSDTIVVAGAPAVLQDVDVRIELDHSYVGDLTISLRHQTGRSTLTDRPFCSANDIDALFNDEGADGPADEMCRTPVAISGEPTPTTPLSAFDGMSATGSWTLSVQDSAVSDQGVLRRWCVLP